jgi:hypothetical protein
MRYSVVLVLATACSSQKQPESEPAPSQPVVGSLVRSDAGITAEVLAADGPEGMHMDEEGEERPQSSYPSRSRAGKPIDVTLRSTPSGAQVAVDGTVIGHTPSFWSGVADGREHEFVFTMRGYAIARYRFVPVASGVIHGRLDPIHEETDAGVPMPPPEVVPRPAPATTMNPPSAPPTIVIDAGVLAPTAPGSGDSAPVGPQP